MFRTTELFTGDDWIPYQFEDLKPGDHFRCFESSGLLAGEFVATTHAKPCSPKGNYQVGVKTILKKLKDR